MTDSENIVQMKLEHRESLIQVLAGLGKFIRAEQYRLRDTLKRSKSPNSKKHLMNAGELEAFNSLQTQLAHLRKETSCASIGHRITASYTIQSGSVSGIDPTPEEIQEATRKLQQEWTEPERQRRAGMEPQPMEFDRVLYPSRVF